MKNRLPILLAALLPLSCVSGEDGVDATIQHRGTAPDGGGLVTLVLVTGASAPCIGDFNEWFVSEEAKGASEIEIVAFNFESSVTGLDKLNGYLEARRVTYAPDPLALVYTGDLQVTKNTSREVRGNFELVDSAGGIQKTSTSFRARKCPDNTGG